MIQSKSRIKIDQFVEVFIQELKNGLPGTEAQKRMSPSIRNHSNKKNDPSLARDSSVLILFYQKGEKIFFPLIQRSNGDHKHSGQISLPGGKYELSDNNLIATAIRETEEELGLQADKIHVIGTITGLYIPISNFQVQPIIGYYEDSPVFKPDSFEVEQVIEAEIQDLFKTDNKKQETIFKNGFKIEAPYYQVKEHKLWGATAMIVSELEELLKRADLIG